MVKTGVLIAAIIIVFVIILITLNHNSGPFANHNIDNFNNILLPSYDPALVYHNKKKSNWRESGTSGFFNMANSLSGIRSYVTGSSLYRYR